MKITKVFANRVNRLPATAYFAGIYRGATGRNYCPSKASFIRLARALNKSNLKNANRYVVVAGQVLRRFGLIAFSKN